MKLRKFTENSLLNLQCYSYFGPEANFMELLSREHYQAILLAITNGNHLNYVSSCGSLAGNHVWLVTKFGC